MKRLIILVCVAVLPLSGCYVGKAAPERISTISKLTLVAIAGDGIQSDHVGFTALTNESSASPLPGLAPQECLIQQASQIPLDNGRITFVPVKQDPKAQLESFRQESGFFDSQYAAAALPRAQQLARSVGADAYLLLFPADMRPCPTAGIRWCGEYGREIFGIWDLRGPLGMGGNKLQLYALFHFELRATEDNSLLAATVVHEKHVLPGVAFSTKLSDYRDEDLASIRQTMIVLCKEGIISGLKQVGLLS